MSPLSPEYYDKEEHRKLLFPPPCRTPTTKIDFNKIVETVPLMAFISGIIEKIDLTDDVREYLIKQIENVVRKTQKPMATAAWRLT